MSRPIAGLVVLLAVLVALGTACGDDGSAPPAAVPEISVVTGEEGEYTFTVPDRVPAGPVRLDLANAGAQAHHAQVLRLDDAATLDDLDAALATGEPAAVLDVGTFVGGTALVSPGADSRADAVLDLEAGTHVLLCFVPGADGLPHLAHGMVQPFEVVAGDGAVVPPAADAEVALADHRFELPETIAGDATLALTNTSAAEPHELVVARLDDGAGVDDVVGALDGGDAPPATSLGGMQALLPGATQRLQLDLAPGRYALFCAVPSPDGTPHYRQGMVAEVEVS